MRIAAVFVALAIAAPWQPTPAPTLSVDGDAAIVTIFVRPERVVEFDSLVARLKSSLGASSNPVRRSQAEGWQVFKSLDRVQGNVPYLMRIDPAVRDQEYDLAQLLGEADPAAASDVSRSVRAAQSGLSIMAMNRVNIDGLGRPAGGAAVESNTPAAPSLVQSFLDGDAAVITVLVRPEHTADYETVLARMAKAMQASTLPIRQRQAAGWKVYKGTQLLSGSVPYITVLDPVLTRTEYDPIRLIQEVFPSEVTDSYARYRAAYAGQAVVSLGQRVDMRR